MPGYPPNLKKCAWTWPSHTLAPRLARELLASLEILSEAEIETLWIDEAIRRDEELDSGAARSYSAEEVLARARARRI